MPTPEFYQSPKAPSPAMAASCLGPAPLAWWRRAESNCRHADFQKTKTPRNNAYLRLRLCEGLQGAAQSGTEDGTTALYGTSFRERVRVGYILRPYLPPRDGL